MRTDVDDIPEELIETIVRGDCVLFIGAGLSIPAGLPRWSDLLSPLYDKIGAPPDTDPLTVAQVFEARESRRQLIAFISEKTDTTRIKPTKNHELLANLGIRTWITTNYDNLIEKTLDDKGHSVSLVVTDANLSLVTRSNTTVIKFHGDRRHPETMVVTKLDLWTHSERFHLIRDKIRTLVAEKTFLFIGYSITHIPHV